MIGKGEERSSIRYIVQAQITTSWVLSVVWVALWVCRVSLADFGPVLLPIVRIDRDQIARSGTINFSLLA